MILEAGLPLGGAVLTHSHGPGDWPINRCTVSSAGRALAGLNRSARTDNVPAGHRFRSQPPGPDLVLAYGQHLRSHSGIAPRYSSCPAADGVIPQLEPLASDFYELASVIGPKPANVIKAAGIHLMVEIEAATNHLVWHQHQVVVIDDLPVAMTLYA